MAWCCARSAQIAVDTEENDHDLAPHPPEDEPDGAPIRPAMKAPKPPKMELSAPRTMSTMPIQYTIVMMLGVTISSKPSVFLHDCPLPEAPRPSVAGTRPDAAKSRTMTETLPSRAAHRQDRLGAAGRRGTGDLRRAWLAALVEDIARCRTRGQEVLIVSSGAVAVGRRHLGLAGAALRLEEKQAAAAAGQIRLAHAYLEALGAHGIGVAQILLTPDDTEERRRHLNARATLEQLLALGAVPVINENDTVATSEIRFGDNDRLAARVAQMISADTLVLLSDIDGLYTADPRRDPRGAPYSRAARHHPGGRGDGRQGAPRLQLGRHGDQARRRRASRWPRAAAW